MPPSFESMALRMLRRMFQRYCCWQQQQQKATTRSVHSQCQFRFLNGVRRFNSMLSSRVTMFGCEHTRRDPTSMANGVRSADCAATSTTQKHVVLAAFNTKSTGLIHVCALCDATLC
jgi:hypothetical protein